jgi:HAE1 family hydrophobic/amphiphilic exporter-1
MNPSAVFVRRPVATILIMGGLLVFGLLGYIELPVNNLPNVDFPTITVSARLAGATPETMAAAVATPLEKQFSTIAGIDTMTSASGPGSTEITLQFALDRDIDAAAQDVQAAIAQTASQLPRDMLTPSYRKLNPAESPILFFALTSPTLPLSVLDEYGQTVLAQNISMIQGVAQVSVYGSQKYAVRIQLDPNRLAARGIGLDQVAQAVRAANVNLPTGTLSGANLAVGIETNADLQTADAFRAVVIDYRDGSLVRLGDLGEVKDDVQNNKVAAWYRDTRAVMLAIQRQPGSNTVEVAAAVRAKVAELSKRLPASVAVNLMYDRSQSIRESVRDVKVTLGLTLIFVVLIIFAFLRNVSATAVPAVALPLSIIGTFGVMYLVGYTLDNLSLMALTLALGFVVDDAIVMLENIVRHREMGKSRWQAALDGSHEVGFTIVSMTVSLVAVFIPILFLGGIMGRLFREFAVTISVAILLSGVIALTLSPMMASRVLRESAGAHHGRWWALTERAWLATAWWYEFSLGWVMRHRRAVLAFSAAILAGTIALGVLIPKGFLPSEDTGMLFGITEAAEGTSFEAMVQHQKVAAQILLADPNIAGFMSAVGAGGPTSLGNQGRFFVRLKDRHERELNADEVVQSLRPRLAKVPGLRAFLRNPPSISVGGTSGKALYQYTLQSTDFDTLQTVVPSFLTELQKSPLLLDVTSDLAIKNPQVQVVIDRDKAAALGVTAERIEDSLYYAYGSRQVSTIYTPTNQYWVMMELLPQYQRDPSALNLLYVRSATGTLVPLAAFASFEETMGPLAINHYGQIPAATVSFNLKPGRSLSEGVAEVEKAARRLPDDVTTTFAGTAQAFKGSQSNLGVLLIIAVLVIYMVLGILYESFVHPLTILTGLPFAGFGALLTLWLFRVDLDLYGFVGLIMLIGVVKKNAIMMIDFAIEGQRAQGLSPAQAIMQAAKVRFRPIMMTTMAALIGSTPIALGLGAGGEARQPLGLAVVGGLAFSQFVTLYVTPVFYTYLDRLQRTRRTPVAGGAS